MVTPQSYVHLEPVKVNLFGKRIFANAILQVKELKKRSPGCCRLAYTGRRASLSAEKAGAGETAE